VPIAPDLTIRSLRTVAVHVPMKRALGTSARRIDIAPPYRSISRPKGITGRAHVSLAILQPHRRSRINPA
jgi:hypothetical protein